MLFTLKAAYVKKQVHTEDRIIKGGKIRNHFSIYCHKYLNSLGPKIKIFRKLTLGQSKFTRFLETEFINNILSALAKKETLSPKAIYSQTQFTFKPALEFVEGKNTH